MSTAREFYTEGKLQQAIDAASANVRSKPADEAARMFLGELLVFAGDLERADLQIEAVVDRASQGALDAILFRQLLRAEQARRQFFSEGRVPEILEGSTSVVRQHLEASVCLKEGDDQEAWRLLSAAAEQRKKIGGICNEKPFSDVRDTDDLLSPVLELLTGNGKYYWVDFERISTIEFRPPERLRDLLWRSAHIVVEGDLEGEVYIPVLYVDSHLADDDRLRLGRMTDWRGGENTVARGIGQRMYEFDDGDVSILELGKLTFDKVAPA